MICHMIDLQGLKNMFKRYLIFQNCAFLYMSFLFFTFLEIFRQQPESKEKEAHIQEGTILINKVSFKHIFEHL